MDQRTLGIYLSRILSGSYNFIYGGSVLKLIYPDISVKYEAELYAEQEYETNKFSDWILEDDIVHTLVGMGVWSYNSDDQLKSIENQIEDAKVDLYKNFLNPGKVKNIKRNISNMRGGYNRLYSIRHSLDQYTLNGYAQLMKNHYILIHSLYDQNNNRIFNNINDIDYNYLINISSYIAENTMDISEYRIIARNDLWKSYWSANSENIFGKSTVNWTDEQKTLVVLTKMYDSAYQHPECPPDSVFEDDDMFDGWMITQKRENEKLRNKNRTEKVLQGKGLDKANEVYIVAGSKEEASNIHDLNDNSAKHIINERNVVLKTTNKEIDETSLPDVQRNLIALSNQQFRDSRKR